jgi:hypothetical protein
MTNTVWRLLFVRVHDVQDSASEVALSSHLSRRLSARAQGVVRE